MMKKITLKQAKQIKEVYGTPAYLYSLDEIHCQYQSIKKILSKKCDLFYSLKANPLLAIVQFFAKKNAGCEVSSKNELLIAMHAGFKPENIIFVGPGKTKEALQLCIEKKIKFIICESIEEIIAVNEMAQKKSMVSQVMVRLNPEFCVEQAPIKMSGVATQFGIEVSQFKQNYQKIKSCKHINLCGIQIYNGSRILSEQGIINNVGQILKCAHDLSDCYKTTWKYIDIGGGFGVPYFKNETDLNVINVVTEINALFNLYNSTYPDTRFILELGRYLVAESGILIASVMSTKINHGKHFSIIDAGMQTHFSATGLNSFIQRNFPAMHLSEKSDSHVKYFYQITGPLCTPGDVMLRDIQFSQIHVGDFIVFFNVGAYGYTASPIRFLSHDVPAELVQSNKNIYLARKRESFSEILSGQINLSHIF